ncbi:MAG: hypothetical protein ACOCP4_03575 [Candidatus Woesearchaeota archaeon]
MIDKILHTGFTITNSKFDTTIVENPFYETSSVRDSLIEQMKNNTIIVHESTNEDFDEKKTEENS